MLILHESTKNTRKFGHMDAQFFTVYNITMKR